MSAVPIRFGLSYVGTAWQSVRRVSDGAWLGWVRRRPGGAPHADWQAVTVESLPVEMRGVRIRTACEGAEVLARIHDGRTVRVLPSRSVRCGHATGAPRVARECVQ